MRVKEIEKIAKKVSRKYYGVRGNDLVRTEKLKYKYGLNFVDVYTELTSFEGGFDLIEALEKKGYRVESQGGCVYRVFTKAEAEKYGV